MKGVSTQMLWTPHCIGGTESADFDPAMHLPEGLTELLRSDTKSPHLKYIDETTGNQFYVVRKGMNPELDSYGIGIENDKRTKTTAAEVFNQIAEQLHDDEYKRAKVNIGGLATNFCVEFSHNNIRDLLGAEFRMRGIESEVGLLADISHGIPIPGGPNDPFSLAGAPHRMAAYDKGNPTTIEYTEDVMRRRAPQPIASGQAIVTGAPEHNRSVA
jgi:hypothetical protein